MKFARLFPFLVVLYLYRSQQLEGASMIRGGKSSSGPIFKRFRRDFKSFKGSTFQDVASSDGISQDNFRGNFQVVAKANLTAHAQIVASSDGMGDQDNVRGNFQVVAKANLTARPETSDQPVVDTSGS